MLLSTQSGPCEQELYIFIVPSPVCLKQMEVFSEKC